MHDPHKILGVSSSATKEEIKKAYRQLAQRYHPDNGKRADAKRFSELAEAYRLLIHAGSDAEQEEKEQSSRPHVNLYRERIHPQRKKQQQAFYRKRLWQAILKTSAATLMGGGIFWAAGVASRFYPPLGLGIGLLVGAVLGLQRFFDLKTFLSPRTYRYSRWVYWTVLVLCVLYVVGMVFHLIR